MIPARRVHLWYATSYIDTHLLHNTGLEKESLVTNGMRNAFALSVDQDT